MQNFVRFPSIEQFKNVVEEAQKEDLKIEMYTGTVKLHGTNGAVVKNGDNSIHYQSRNRILNTDNDNMEFYKMNSPKEHVYKQLFQDIINTLGCIEANLQIVLFGEWCGGKLSSTVAIGKLPRMFVIFAIKVGNRYLKLKNIHFNNEQIYNIYQFPTFKLNINFEKPELTTQTLEDLTQRIDTECPVGKFFGVQGTGEGIVWTRNSCEKPGWWFKTKGKTHRISIKNKIPVKTQTMQKESDFVQEFVTTERLEQGFKFLQEQQIPLKIQNIKHYNTFICQDIIKEEQDIITKNELNVKNISKLSSKVSGDYYKKKIFGW